MYYLIYIYKIREIPLNRLKFLDESHFDGFKDMRTVIITDKDSPPAQYPTRQSLNERFSITLMTTLDPTEPLPYVVDIRFGNNDQSDFLRFIVYLIELGHLERGDHLVMDNASIHHGAATIDMLQRLFDAAGIHPIFLPAYSPELNPCELVFAMVKNQVRGIPRSSDGFMSDLAKAFAKVNILNVANMYHKCTTLENVLKNFGMFV